MRVMCVRDCQFHGIVIHKGEERDLPETALKERPNNFRPATDNDGGEDDSERPAGSPELLTRGQLKQRLDAMGIPYRVRDSYASLKELFDRAVAADPVTRIGG